MIYLSFANTIKMNVEDKFDLQNLFINFETLITIVEVFELCPKVEQYITICYVLDK